MLKTSLLVSLVEVLELMGVRSQNRKITRLDEDEKLAELISVVTRKDWGSSLRWWTFGELRGCFYSVFILRDVASDKRLDVTCYFSAVPFKIVLQKGLTVDLKSSRSGLFASQSRKQQRFLLSLAQFWQVAPRLPGGR